MSAEWKCRATRGEHAVSVLTAKRAFGTSSVTVRGTTCRFLLRILADGDTQHFEVLCPNEQSVRTWLEDMQPHSVEILVGENEDADIVTAGYTWPNPLTGFVVVAVQHAGTCHASKSSEDARAI